MQGGGILPAFTIIPRGASDTRTVDLPKPFPTALPDVNVKTIGVWELVQLKLGLTLQFVLLAGYSGLNCDGVGWAQPALVKGCWPLPKALAGAPVF